MYSLFFFHLAAIVPSTMRPVQPFWESEKRGPDWWVEEGGPRWSWTQSRLNGSPDPSLPMRETLIFFYLFGFWNYRQSLKARWLRTDELQFVFGKKNHLIGMKYSSREGEVLTYLHRLRGLGPSQDDLA